jgi:hypothetical protein
LALSMNVRQQFEESLDHDAGAIASVLDTHLT